MKDTAESMDLGVSQQRSAAGSRTWAWLQNEFVRVGLAETLCTYIMMVRDIPQQKKTKTKSHAEPLEAPASPPVLCFDSREENHLPLIIKAVILTSLTRSPFVGARAAARARVALRSHGSRARTGIGG